MTPTNDQPLHRMMDGSDQSLSAALLLGATRLAEPFYATTMTLRNILYDVKLLPSKPLGRPTVSVGNITTGGTGKTPVVQWLAKHFASAGRVPAVLLRGYKSSPGGISDETTLLTAGLAATAAGAVPVIANPNRLQGAAQALESFPQTTTFILDDAMQHRRARRDFELVLIHAADPFGFHHVLPRGLLREPLQGLRRADAFLITHAREANESSLQSIHKTLRRHNPSAPIFHADHLIDGFTDAADQPHPLSFIEGKPYLAFSGIGSPDSFLKALDHTSGSRAGATAFPDHYAYVDNDLAQLAKLAELIRAQLMVTTEKDWVKLSKLPSVGQMPLPVIRAQLSIKFWGDDETKLQDEIERALKWIK